VSHSKQISGGYKDVSFPRLSASEAELTQRTPTCDFTSQDDGAAVYLAGLGGTILAGGFFPIVIFAVIFAANMFSGRLVSFGQIGETMLAIFLAFFFGSVLALLAAICIFPLVGVLDWIASLQRWRRLLVSCAGGWCGFASVATLAGQRAEGMIYILQFGAMALGQLGAAIVIRRTCGRERRPLDEASANSNQVPLRQLFGITTAVALAAAVLTSLPIAPQTLTAMGFAAACQAFVAACYVIARRASIEAQSEHAASDVSRETTVATFLD
jgi:hypothetical protein